MAKLEIKIALVTGASSGIGLAVVEIVDGLSFDALQRLTGVPLSRG